MAWDNAGESRLLAQPPKTGCQTCTAVHPALQLWGCLPINDASAPAGGDLGGTAETVTAPVH